jgi:hypothetical protein
MFSNNEKAAICRDAHPVDFNFLYSIVRHCNSENEALSAIKTLRITQPKIWTTRRSPLSTRVIY